MMDAGQVSSLVKDRAAAKDLAVFAKHLEELDATPQQVSSSNSPNPPCHVTILAKCSSLCLIVYPFCALPMYDSTM